MTARSAARALRRLSAVAVASLAAACDGAPPTPPAPPAGAPAPRTATAVPPASAPLAAPPAATGPRDMRTPPEIVWKTHGKGPELRVGDQPMMHVEARLVADGRVILDTRRTDAPIPYRIGSGQSVPAWDMVLPKLRVGDRVTTRVRSDLAWGDRGVPHAVPERSDVDFDITVLTVIEPPKWEVLASGTGREALPGTLATIHFRGWLSDGKQFEDSWKAGKPVQFMVGAGAVIEGWDYAVSRMRAGDRWKISIPWVLAFGPDGVAPNIPPKADLTYEIEVLRVDD